MTINLLNCIKKTFFENFYIFKNILKNRDKKWVMRNKKWVIRKLCNRL
jgi:hypothetical protein